MIVERNVYHSNVITLIRYKLPSLSVTIYHECAYDGHEDIYIFGLNTGRQVRIATNGAFALQSGMRIHSDGETSWS